MESETLPVFLFTSGMKVNGGRVHLCSYLILVNRLIEDEALPTRMFLTASG